MEGHGHDAVRQVEGFLHAVAVVNVDVDVENPRVVLEQLQDADDDVVDVAEARRLETEKSVLPTKPPPNVSSDTTHRLRKRRFSTDEGSHNIRRSPQISWRDANLRPS